MSRDFCLEDFPALRGKHVRIRDERALIRTINRILKDGPNSLQIVTDFDLTLTKQHVNGKKVLSSFGIFSKCKQLPATYARESARLYKQYRPMEIDPTLTLRARARAMDDWMIAAEGILKDLTFDPNEIPEVARAYGGELRDGTRELFLGLRDAGVPVVVFSAGLGDVVEAVLKQHEVFLDNVKVISNFLKYEDGKIVGFASPRLIHVFNKHEHAHAQMHFRSSARRNVLLMGDTIGDALMVDGLGDDHAVVKVGFLYDHVEESLSSFMEKYDVVLIDDQTMAVPAEILRPIL